MSLSRTSISKVIVEVNDYGDGLLEGTWWEPHEKREGNNRRKDLPPKVRRYRDALNRERTLRKRKKRVRQAVMAMPAVYLWSATYESNMQDYSKAKGDFETFLRELRAMYPEIRSQWVAVAEPQKRGAWHWHFALPVYVPKAVIDRIWHEASGEQGYTFVSGPKRHQHLSGPVKKVKASLYLSKYFSKDMGEDREAYEHAYKVGRGVVIPVERYEFPTIYEARAFVDALQQYQYLNDEKEWREGGWFCTWTLTG